MLELVSGNKTIGICVTVNSLNNPILCVIDSEGLDLNKIDNSEYPKLVSEKGIFTIEYQTVEAIDTWIERLNNMK